MYITQCQLPSSHFSSLFSKVYPQSHLGVVSLKLQSTITLVHFILFWEIMNLLNALVKQVYSTLILFQYPKIFRYMQTTVEDPKLCHEAGIFARHRNNQICRSSQHPSNERVLYDGAVSS
jgi:hypothetical protein